MRFSKAFCLLLKGWFWSFLIFGLLSLGLASQFVLSGSVPAQEIVRATMRDWLPWAVIAPFLFQFVGRFPLEREKWKWTLPLHLVCAVATVGLCTVWAEIILPPPFSRMPPHEPRDAPPQLRPEPPQLPPPLQDPPPLSDRFPRPPGKPPFNPLFTWGIRLPVYLAIVGIAHALYFYRSSQERERRSLALSASLAKARLEALKMQLQPHFLFNSLNAIAELVHKDPNAADEMLVALSDFLRLTLETSGEQELPLRRELEFVQRYLAIERARFGERLRTAFAIAPAAEEALVPAFVLQPLVENAIRHGFEARSGVGSLEIRARREGDALLLAVADNGAGLPDGKPLREGIGLGNTKARLRELYGKSAKLELRDANGLTVEIAIPFRLADEN